MIARTLCIAALGLAAGALAAAQDVPLPGTYVSADGRFALTITGANPGNGRIAGTYRTGYSPAGSWAIEGNHVGDYAWVYSDAAGREGVAPFSITFGAGTRPDGWKYVVKDTWNGAYLADDSILAEGARTFVDSTGKVQVGSLGTQVFTLRH